MLRERRERAKIPTPRSMNSSTVPANLTNGGGAEAVELAEAFPRLGVLVTVVQRGDHLLSKFDPDAATVVEEVFRREGLGISTNTKLTDARSERDQKVDAFQHLGSPMTFMPHKRQTQP